MGFHKFSSTHRSEESLKTLNYRERHEKTCPYLTHQTSKTRNHVNLETKSEPALKPYYPPVRHKKRNVSRRTRTASKRKPGVVSRPKGLEDVEETRLNNQRFDTGDVQLEEQRSVFIESLSNEICQENGDRTKFFDEEQKHMKNKKTGPRTNQHEYLQFLLRITEDIIMNNYFRNEDIMNVFQYHIEANKDRLDMDKMFEHVRRLSAELNIVFDPNENYVSEDLKPDFQIPVHSVQAQQFDSDCECCTKRVLSIERIEVGNFVNLLENKHSLDKLTEHTEPTNSSDTLCYSKGSVSATESLQEFINNEKETVSEFCIKENYGDIGDSLRKVKSLGDVPTNRLGKPALNILENILRKTERQLVISTPKVVDCIIDTPKTIESLAVPECGVNIPKLVDSLDNIPEGDESLVNTPKVVDSLVSISEGDESVDSIPGNNEPVVGLPNIIETVDIPKDEAANMNDDKVDSDEKPSTNSIENPDPKIELDHLTTANGNTNNMQAEIKEDSLEKPRTIMKDDISQTDEQIVKRDQYTQVLIDYSDKDCNTTDDIVISDVEENNDYILINGPVYVLKKVFNLDKTIILANPLQLEMDYAPVKETSSENLANPDANTIGDNSNSDVRSMESNPEVTTRSVDNPTETVTNSQMSVMEMPRLCRERTFVKERFHSNLSDYSIPSETSLNPFYLNEKNFYRLLYSDYDITPQRDTNIDKYHHLLVDASTSATSLQIDSAVEQNLLKSDYYAIENSQTDVEKYQVT